VSTRPLSDWTEYHALVSAVVSAFVGELIGANQPQRATRNFDAFREFCQKICHEKVTLDGEVMTRLEVILRDWAGSKAAPIFARADFVSVDGMHSGWLERVVRRLPT
jgi:hypothetical protein